MSKFEFHFPISKPFKIIATVVTVCINTRLTSGLDVNIKVKFSKIIRILQQLARLYVGSMFSVTCFFFNNIEIESSDNAEDTIVRRQKTSTLIPPCYYYSTLLCF